LPEIPTAFFGGGSNGGDVFGHEDETFKFGLFYQNGFDFLV